MNKLNIADVSMEKVKITVQDSAAGVSVKITGDVDMEDPSAVLDPIFDEVHTGAINQKMKEIILDVNELNFLNSSGIKAIAKWVMKLSDIKDDEKYSIKIAYDKDTAWQVTSLPTLTYLVPGAVVLE